MNSFTVIVLAGGEGKRVGGKDKGLIEFDGKPLIERAIATFAPQAAQLLISANRNQEIYQQYGFPVISDAMVPDPANQSQREIADTTHRKGPLAGIAACLEHTQTDYAFVMACDMPLLRPDIIDRLYTKLLIDKTRIAVAHDGDRLQPLCSLIHRSCLAALKRALEENKLKVVQWITEQNPAIADCSDIKDAFININTLNDIKSP